MVSPLPSLSYHWNFIWCLIKHCFNVISPTNISHSKTAYYFFPIHFFSCLPNQVLHKVYEYRLCLTKYTSWNLSMAEPSRQKPPVARPWDVLGASQKGLLKSQNWEKVCERGWRRTGGKKAKYKRGPDTKGKAASRSTQWKQWQSRYRQTKTWFGTNLKERVFQSSLVNSALSPLCIDLRRGHSTVNGNQVLVAGQGRGS